MFRPADAGVLAAALAAALAVVLGGAFAPGPRLVVVLVLALAAALGGAGLRGRLPLEERLLLVLFGWALAVALARGLSPLAAKETVTAWLAAGLVWALARRAAEPVRRLAATVVLVTAGVLAAAVAAEWSTLGSPRAGGLVENPNVAAALLAPVAVAVWAASRGGRRRLPVAVISGLLALAVLATGSRAALVALAAAVLLVPVRPRVRIVAALLAAAVVAGAISWRLAVQRDVLAWHRTAIWGAVLGVVAEHPITGVGPGSWADVAGRARITYRESLARHEMRPTYAESTPLAVAAELGGVGLLLAAAWAAAAAAAIRRRGDGGRERPALGPLLATLAVIAVFHDLLRVEVVLWWWALVVGLIEPRLPSGPLTARWPGAATGIALAGLLLWGLGAPAEAARRWQLSAGAASERAVEHALLAEPWFSRPAVERAARLARGAGWGWSEATEALRWAERAVRVHPGDAEGWMTLGTVATRTVVELGSTPGLVGRAREGYRRSTELEPHLPWAWSEWARLERALGRLAVSRGLAERAVTEEPAFVRGWLLLARIELDLGRVVEAERAVARVQALGRLRPARQLGGYERELLRLPWWQLAELEAALPAPGGSR